ncbi:AmmeMemoRadiSam system protein B [Sulfurimonas sp.]|nr:AmmeMemoRadiSam system protein B [Sulfurimonas sp.]
MRTTHSIVLFFLSLVFMQNIQALDRPTAVAGSFYPQDKKELSNELSRLFKDAKNFDTQNINAIIVPHAGYVYSAPTATLAYKTLHKKYKNIFLIGSSHHVNVNAASIYNQGNYQTPLGVAQVNQDIVSKLFENKQLFSYYEDAHTKEHTLEVQVPFLQTVYGEDLRIVPIIISTSNIQTIQAIAQSLEPYFNDDNLFVISTDLSHFPNYEDANIVDKRTLHSIATNKSQTFLNTLKENEDLKLNEHYTSACGYSSVLALMYLTENKNYNYEVLDYTNSGDTEYGDKKRVVGYGSLRIYSAKQDTFLTQEEKDQLLQIAQMSLEEATLNNKRISLDSSKLHPKLLEHLGAFVTLYKDSQLRGCIGRFEPNQSLSDVVIDMSIAAAQQDPRFTKVSQEELNNIDIEISVLTPRKKIASMDEIVIGKHGVYVQKGLKHGTYLPHVATQMHWNVSEFVQSCAVEKAGMNNQDINEMELFTYEAIVFGDKKSD